MNIYPKKKSGFTLVEVLIAVFILSIGIVSTLMFFSTAMTTADYSRDVTVATSHGECILEEMKTKKSTFDIVAVNWENWLSDNGFALLPQERVRVDITKVLENSLDIKVTVDWVKRARIFNVTLQTEITK